ncbi:MAG: 30S ribosome-binding factor RbfA [bacterium]
MSRLEQVNDLLRDEVASLIKKSIDFASGTIFTVTKVQTSDDLKYAKIFVSVMPKDKETEVLEILETEIGNIQRGLNKKLVMRYVPKIRFVIDDSEGKVARIEELLNNDQ